MTGAGVHLLTRSGIFKKKSSTKIIITPRVCYLNEFSIATYFFLLAGLSEGSIIESVTLIILVFKFFFFYLNIMMTGDQQKKIVGSSPEVILGIFLQIQT